MKDILKRPYTRCFIPEDDGGFSACMLEFPGCVAQGDTIEDAYNALEQAARAWLDAMAGSGREIPAPSKLRCRKQSVEAIKKELWGKLGRMQCWANIELSDGSIIHLDATVDDINSDERWLIWRDNGAATARKSGGRVRWEDVVSVLPDWGG